VDNFGFDDSQLRTLGMGKQPVVNSGADWGTIKILVFPAGTEIPPPAKPPVSPSDGIASDLPAHASADSTSKP